MPLNSSRGAGSSIAGSNASIGATFEIATHSVAACIVGWVAVVAFSQTAFD